MVKLYKFIKIYMAKCTLIYITFVRCRLEGGPGALGQPALWIGLYPQSHYQSLVTTSTVKILFFLKQTLNNETFQFAEELLLSEWENSKSREVLIALSEISSIPS